MKKSYAFKRYYQPMFMAFTVIALIAAILNFLLGKPIAWLMLLATVFNFLQYRLYTHPYIEVEQGVITARFTFLKKITINLEDVTAISPESNQLILYLRDGSKTLLFLSSLTESDQQRITRELPNLIKGAFLIFRPK